MNEDDVREVFVNTLPLLQKYQDLTNEALSGIKNFEDYIGLVSALCSCLTVVILKNSEKGLCRHNMENVCRSLMARLEDYE